MKQIAAQELQLAADAKATVLVEKQIVKYVEVKVQDETRLRGERARVCHRRERERWKGR